jgi:hypothetical protein
MLKSQTKNKARQKKKKKGRHGKAKKPKRLLTALRREFSARKVEGRREVTSGAEFSAQ